MLNPHGSPGRLFAEARLGFFQLITSQEQLDSIANVLMRPKFGGRFTQADADRLSGEIRDAAIVVEPQSGITATIDPEDNRVLGSAVAGKADYLVSGDERHLLPLQSYKGISILRPAEMLRIIED